MGDLTTRCGRYQLLWRPRSYNDDGHFVWRRSDGEIVLSDWSGPEPERTDDGPLLVRTTQPAQIAWSERWAYVIIPVLVERTGGPGKVMTGPRTAAFLARHEPLLRFEPTPELVARLGPLLQLLPWSTVDKLHRGVHE